MGRKLAALAIGATAAATAVSVGAAGPVASKQRVAITARSGVSGVNGFLLTPLKAGAVKRDVGSVAWGDASERFVVRDGQKVEIDKVLATLTGKAGTLQLHFRIEWLDAGNKYVIGVGSWKVVRGTGGYEHLTGGGRSASSWLPRGPVSFRAEGFVQR